MKFAALLVPRGKKKSSADCCATMRGFRMRERRDKAVRMLAEGFTIADAAKLLGVSSAAIYRYKRDASIIPSRVLPSE